LLYELGDACDELGRLAYRSKFSDQRIEAWRGTARCQKAKTL
jgi:hypothetical protein